jgi:hypothetical protein
MTGNPEVIGSSLRLVPTNALAVTDRLLPKSRLPGTDQARFPEVRFWIARALLERSPAGIHEVKIASAGALARQMERFGPGHQVGQEVTGSVHDNQHSKILRSHPQNAEEETGKRGQRDRVPNSHE